MKKLTMNSTKPVEGLEHLKTGVRDGQRWYDVQADEAMHPRYRSEERARCFPNEAFVGSPGDAVLHYKMEPLKVRRLVHDNGKTITVCHYKRRGRSYLEVREVVDKSDLRGIYPVKARVDTLHHPDYNPNRGDDGPLPKA